MFQRELTPEDYIAMLRRRWVLIVILALIGGSIAYGASRFLPNRYQSQALVLIEKPTVPTDFVKPVANTDVPERLMTMEQQVLSQARLEPLIHQFGLFPKETSEQMPTASIVATLRNSIEVAPIRSVPDDPNSISSFHVRVTMDSPQLAQVVCAAITSMFVQESARSREEQGEETTQFLGQQIADAKAKLDEQDSKLAAFQGRHLGSLPDDAQANLSMIAGLTSELDAATQALTRAQQDKSLAESMLTQQIAARQASQTGQNPDTFGEQLAALQTKLADLQARYTDDYPDVVKTKIEIAALKKKIIESENQNRSETPNTPGNSSIEPLQFIQLRAQIRTDDQTIAQKTKQQEQIQEQIKSYQERVQLSPVVSQEYKQLTRDHQTALDFYNSLLRKRADSVMATDLETRQEGERFHVLEPANLPAQPSAPNRQLFGLGGVGGGLTLGFALALFLEMRDTSLRNERDIELLLQLPVLATVPVIEPVSASQSAPAIDQARLVSASKGD